MCIRGLGFCESEQGQFANASKVCKPPGKNFPAGKRYQHDALVPTMRHLSSGQNAYKKKQKLFGTNRLKFQRKLKKPATI